MERGRKEEERWRRRRRGRGSKRRRDRGRREKGGGGSSIGEGVKVNKGEERETDSAQLTVAEGKCDREETPLEMKENSRKRERLMELIIGRRKERREMGGRGEEGVTLRKKEKRHTRTSCSSQQGSSFKAH